MKILSFLLLGLWSVASATPPVVSNIRASQRPGTKLVDVYYDLADPDGDTQTVGMLVSSDAGLTYTVPCATVTGAVGSGLAAGTNKHILWDAGADWNGNFVPQTKVRITAMDGSLPAAPAGMAAIPGGTFQMGDTMDSSSGRTAIITISAFFCDKTEVPKSLYDTVRNWGLANGYALYSGASFGGGNQPVHSVTWFDAVKWCNARSQMERLTPCYYTDTAQTVVYKTGDAGLSPAMVKWSANGYRLPTESEWERAARGGLTNRRFPWGDTITHSQAVYYSITSYAYDVSPTRGYHPTWGSGTAPVGTFQANGYGLYDMAGNVWEWAWDWWGGELGTPSVVDPDGPASGSYRVLRGGDWYGDSSGCRVGVRGNGNPSHGYYGFGFRSVRR